MGSQDVVWGMELGASDFNGGVDLGLCCRRPVEARGWFTSSAG